jgi:8-oxo-dGTP pyrophosphatase MutT (NUDIX family)
VTASTPTSSGEASRPADPVEDYVITARQPLRADDAIVAIIVRADGKYVLQQRSQLPTIWYPGHWGVFGGGMDPGETPIETLRRELREELEYELRDASFFFRLDFDFSMIGQGKRFRSYYLVEVSQAEFDGFRLHEGDAIEAFAPDDVFGRLRVTPYDAFALWLHYARGRFARPSVAAGRH